MKKISILVAFCALATVGLSGCKKNKPSVTYYTVTFKNYDESLLSESKVKKGDTVIYNGQTPSRANTAEFEYTFNGWDQSLENITSNCVRYAQYIESAIPVTVYYTVSFKNYDGTLLDEIQVEKGGTAVYGGVDPTKPETSEYTYTFNGWDKPLANITGDCTRIAQYTETKKQVVTYYTVTFKNYDGTLLTTDIVEKGGTATYSGTTPTRPETSEFSYEFNGWDKPLSDITSDCVRIAQFTSTAKPVTVYYTVSFKNYDGTLLYDDYVVKGGTATYGGPNPTRPETTEYTYSFSGWDKSLSNITSNCTRIAQYNKTAKPVTVTYVVSFKNYDGTLLDEDRVEKNGTATYGGTTPTRPETSEFSYTFNGWDKSLSNITSDCTRIAQYIETAKPVTNYFSVTFKNYDGSILHEAIVKEGGNVTYGGPTPIRLANSEFTYTFDGWDGSLENITSNCIRIAQYTETYVEYTVKFYNYDNELLYVDTVHYKDGATYDGVPPTKPSTDTHYYTFVGWDKDITCITDSINVKAMFSGHGDDRHIIVNPNNGENSGEIEVAFDEPYDLGTPSFPGFVFLGWYSDETLIPTTGTWQYSGVSSVTAKWQNVYFVFTDNGDDTYTVSLNDDGKLATEIVIPSVYEGIPVTAMGADFLRENQKIEKITIPGSIKNIPSYSFYNCKQLSEVKLNEGLISIGTYAFAYCGLKTLVIPSTCTTIGSWSFEYNSSLYEIYLPRSVTTMGNYVFYSLGTNAYICLEHESVPSNWDSSWTTATRYINCTKLVHGEDFNYVIRSNYGDLSVVILRLTEATSKLQNYTVPTEIEGISDIRIGRYVFKDNKYIRSVDLTGVTYIYYQAFNAASNLHTVTFSEGLVSIEKSAFESCSALTRVVIPYSCTEILDFAFEYCSSLEYIFIPSTTVTIGQYNFYGTGSGNIYTDAHSAGSKWGDSWNGSRTVYYDYVLDGETDDFYYAVQSYMEEPYVSITGLKDAAKLKKNLVIPDQIEGISDIRLKYGLFNTSKELVSINLGQGVKSIPSTCFRDSSKLETVVLGDNVTTINSMAFYNCAKLSSINMPNSLKTIGSSAFSYCSSLGEIIIPISVTTIGETAFNYTGRLVYLIEATVDQPNWDSAWYGNTTTNKTFIYSYTSFGVVGDFKYASSDNGAVDTIYILGLADDSTNLNLVVPNSIDDISNIKIASYAFAGNTLIKSIDLGNSVTSINRYAFSGCTSLRSVIIPATCSVIKEYAFQSCSTECVLNCVVSTKPDGWDSKWNYSNCQVVWGYVR